MYIHCRLGPPQNTPAATEAWLDPGISSYLCAGRGEQGLSDLELMSRRRCP